MRLTFSFVRGELDRAFKEISEPLADTATAAVTRAGQAALADGRASIGAAGFSTRWKNTLRLDVYPKGRTSMRAAAHIYHKIGYAGVFEDGATILGKPQVWLPLDTAKGDGGKRMPPAKFIQKGGKLRSLNRPGKPPLLIGTPFGRDKAVPMYVGLSLVQIAKKFGVTAAVRRAAARLPEFYRASIRAGKA